MFRVVGSFSLVVVLVIASSCQSSNSPLSRSAPPGSKRGSLELVQVVSAPEEPTIVSADRQGVVAAGRYGAVAAFNSAGREIWRKTVTGPGQQILRPMAITPDRVVVPSTPDRIVALNRDTGQEEWSRPVNNPWSVGIDANTAAVVSRTGILTTFAVATGNLYGEQNLGFSEAIVAPPISCSISTTAYLFASSSAGWSTTPQPRPRRSRTPAYRHSSPIACCSACSHRRSRPPHPRA